MKNEHDDVEAQDFEVGSRRDSKQQPAVAVAQWSWIQWTAVASVGIIAICALGVSIAAFAAREEEPSGGAMISQQTIRVLKSGGFSYAFHALHSSFEETYPWIKMEVEDGSSFGTATTSIPSRLARGEQWDVLIMVQEGFGAMVDRGYAYNQSDVVLGVSPIGLCVQSDIQVTAVHISTEESFRMTLLNECETVAVSDSASGRYLISNVFDAEINNRTTAISSDETGRVGTLAVAGDPRAQCVLQQVPELLETGCHFVGTIPASVQLYTPFVGGISKSVDPEHLDAANVVLYFLTSPAGASVIERSGMVPGTPAVPGGWSRVSYSSFFGEGMHQQAEPTTNSSSR
eukprot:g5158.t1